MPFGVGSAVVLSGSMEPAVSVGDLLIISRQDSYQVGDIVVYQSGRIAVTHRIVSISEDEVITRGDANNTEDDPIPPEHIKGEVVLIIPCVGYLVNIIKTPLVTLVIIALAVFLMERSFRAEKEKDKQRLEDIKAEIEKLKRDQFPKS
jgi:signal peptidase